MLHGDDKGLVLPPRVAPIQVVIVPIYYSAADKEAILNKSMELKWTLVKRDLRIQIDARDEFTPGYKFNDWEMKGVPLRIEIGPKDLAKGKMVLVRRDNLKKLDLTFDKTEEGVINALNNIQQTLFENAKRLLNERTTKTTDFDEFKRDLEKGMFVYSPWCGDQKCEEIVKESTGADIRVIPFDEKKTDSPCIICKNSSKVEVIFARSY